MARAVVEDVPTAIVTPPPVVHKYHLQGKGREGKGREGKEKKEGRKERREEGRRMEGRKEISK